MNRREILALFGLAPFIPPIAELALMRPDYVPRVYPAAETDPLTPLEGHPIGFSIMSNFFAAGHAKESRHARIEILRESNTAVLLRFSMNAFGGLLTWHSVADSFIFPGDDRPLVTCSDPDVRWCLPLHTPTGHVAMTERGLVRLEA